jgi:hypothetical protein
MHDCALTLIPFASKCESFGGGSNACRSVCLSLFGKLSLIIGEAGLNYDVDASHWTRHAYSVPECHTRHAKKNRSRSTNPLTRTGAGGRYQCPSPHPTEWLDEWSWSFAARACDILAGARYNSQGLGARGRATMGIDMRQHAAAWARLS